MARSETVKHLLSYDDTYPCPVCRFGQLSNITLTEAFGCNTCRHIFITSSRQNQLKIADREPAMTWRWNGQTWRGEHIGDLELSWVYWLAALALISFPPGLVGLTALIFPSPGGGMALFPIIWTGITFAAHLSIVLWLLTEAYQFPVWVYLKARWQRLFQLG
ncbi:MAG: hypothetical protein HC835_03330 [Oscillatoriales cyanobacterium RM2_1_1]|nr:hypothetical protein [Oscillatoriales cyanobacterium SM2_3_0]NJO44726.1 hypothetical protein [Oscillatoriales cyanobacterium RM2_1_1]